MMALRSRFWWLTTALCVLLAPLALGQEALDRSKPLWRDLPPDQMGTAATALVQSINAAVVEFDALQSAMSQTTAEDSLVFELQVFRLQQQFLEDLHDLCGAVRKMQATTPQPELRQELEGLFARVTIPLLGFHNELRAEIDAVRARRTTAAPAQRAAVEEDLLRLTDRLDRVLQLTHRYLQDMKLLEMQTATPLASFQSILSARAHELFGRVEFSLARVDDLEARLRNTPEDADNKLLLLASKRSLDTNTASMETVVQIMEEGHGLLGCVLGCHACCENPFRRRGRLDPLPAA